MDVLPADKKFVAPIEEFDFDTGEFEQNIGRQFLRQQLVEAARNYDYVLIDMPPNWRWLSQSGVLASDVLIVPANHIDRSSLQNLEDLVTTFLPDVAGWRTEIEDGPVGLLPLVLNRYQHTTAQAKNCKEFLDRISQQNPNWEKAFNNFFYIERPAMWGFGIEKRCLELPYVVEIASSPLQGSKYVPAPLRYKKARETYESLIREVIRDV